MAFVARAERAGVGWVRPSIPFEVSTDHGQTWTAAASVLAYHRDWFSWFVEGDARESSFVLLADGNTVMLREPPTTTAATSEGALIREDVGWVIRGTYRKPWKLNSQAAVPAHVTIRTVGDTAGSSFIGALPCRRVRATTGHLVMRLFVAVLILGILGSLESAGASFVVRSLTVVSVANIGVVYAVVLVALVAGAAAIYAVIELVMVSLALLLRLFGGAWRSRSGRLLS